MASRTILTSLNARTTITGQPVNLVTTARGRVGLWRVGIDKVAVGDTGTQNVLVFRAVLSFNDARTVLTASDGIF